jgi:hypothetical protein
MLTGSHTKPQVGIIGIPPRQVIAELNARGCVIFDLDEPLLRRPIDDAGELLPKVYCAILRTAVINAMGLNLEAIYIDTGPGKCDCASHVATILADALPGTDIIRTTNLDCDDFGTPVSTTRMPLVAKLEAITASVKSVQPHRQHPPCTPTVGFWGVPPRDFSFLEPFPDTTHVFGWSRCMENKTPYNPALEEHVDHTIPMVFFAQSFCAKTALARHLARRHPRALFVDGDVSATNSGRAKIQAFIELCGVDNAAC